jgi:hypothetical protein
MNNDYWVFPIFMMATCFGIIVFAFSYSNGKTDGKNEGIVYCIEKPQECKIQYDYLKLQENQK